MGFVWPMLLMLQLIVNYQNMINMPAPALLMLENVSMVVYFNIQNVPIVKSFIAEHSQTVNNLLDQYDLLPFIIIIFIIMIALIYPMKHLVKNSVTAKKIYEKVLNALMWNSVLRSLIQTYIQLSYKTLVSLKALSFQSA